VPRMKDLVVEEREDRNGGSIFTVVGRPWVEGWFSTFGCTIPPDDSHLDGSWVGAKAELLWM